MMVSVTPMAIADAALMAGGVTVGVTPVGLALGPIHSTRTVDRGPALHRTR